MQYKFSAYSKIKYGYSWTYSVIYTGIEEKYSDI